MDRQMGLQELLMQNSLEVNEALEIWLDENHTPNAKLNEAIDYALLAKGKRLRSFLVRQSAYLCAPFCNISDKPDENAIMVMAMAIEIMHCYSLVHDDLPAMDDDDMRRGRPTLHKKFDEATAILTGDALLTASFQILSQRGILPDSTRIRLISGMAMASGGHGMIAGQMMDLFPSDDHQTQLAYLKDMHSLKTGALIQFSTLAGAILYGLDGQIEQDLITYGEAIGRLFQLTDDLLDDYGNSKVMGKKTGKDIKAGKLNAVALLGVKQTETQADEALEDALMALQSYRGQNAEILRELAHYLRYRTK